MLVSDKIFVKSMKYDTKLYTYDTEYDTKTINQNDNLCYSFYNIAQNTTNLFVQTYKYISLCLTNETVCIII